MVEKNCTRNNLDLALSQDSMYNFYKKLFSLAFYFNHGWRPIHITVLLAPTYQDHLLLVQ